MKVTFTKKCLLPCGLQNANATLEVSEALGTTLKSIGVAKDYVAPSKVQEPEEPEEASSAQETKVEPEEAKKTKAAK